MLRNPNIFEFIEEKTLFLLFSICTSMLNHIALFQERADEDMTFYFLSLRAAAAAKFPSEQICTTTEETEFQRKLGPAGNLKVTELKRVLCHSLVSNN